LVICRAGASSLAELAAAGKAAILIPLVSKDDHQTPNAQELAEQGAAVVMKQNKTTGADLASVLKGLILDRNRVAVMAGKMALRSQENAEDEIIRGLSEMLKSSR
jgi:UDP-N-acetylglucosamine--N-acetylmuramyl-(pentapeptide) pyrophosphoryl-undecaprenol N-acetylglucosamine transferase